MITRLLLVTDGAEKFSIVGTGSTAPDEKFIGYRVQYEDSAKMNVSLMLSTMRYFLVYSIPKSNWHHYLVTWSHVSGLMLYEDGVKVSDGAKESKGHIENSLRKIFVGHGTVNNGTQLHDLRFWQFKLSEFDAKNLFSPSEDFNNLDYLMQIALCTFERNCCQLGVMILLHTLGYFLTILMVYLTGFWALLFASNM